MTRKINRPKLEAASKRAAEVATTGPRSARAGRFIATGPAKRLPNEMIIEHVSSTAIDAIAYDEQRLLLRIRFKSGRTYSYENVPVDVYEELLSAESQGAYFNRNIRDAFEYREVR